MAGHVALTGKRRDAYRISAGNSEGKRPPERPRRIWGIIFRWILRKWDGGMDWIALDQERDRWRALSKAAMNLRVP